MRARRHAFGGFRARQHRADRKAAAERLRQRHHIGRDAEAAIGKEIAGAAHAGLHLVEGEQQAMLVAELAQRLEEGMRRRAHAALALHRLDQDAGGVRADRLLHGLEVAMRHLVEAVHRRAETFEIFGGAGGGERRQRAAMEGAFEGDDAVALAMAFGEMIVAHQLDHALHRFSAGIAEEHEVGKALLAQACGQHLAVRALEQVRHVPEPGRLLLQRLHQMRVRVPQRVHRHTRGEVEIAIAIGCDEPAALATLEAEIDPGENGKQMRCGAGAHGVHLTVRGWGLSRRAVAHIMTRGLKRNVPPFKGGTRQYSRRKAIGVNAASRRF